MNIALVGAGGRGPTLALIDGHDAAAGRRGKCAGYVDLREMLDREKSLDAVLCATPDHPALERPEVHATAGDQNVSGAHCCGRQNDQIFLAVAGNPRAGQRRDVARHTQSRQQLLRIGQSRGSLGKEVATVEVDPNCWTGGGPV